MPSFLHYPLPSQRERERREREMMEGLYLLCSIASTFVTTTLLSLILFLRSLLLTCTLSPSSSSGEQDGAVKLYQGHVRHVRKRPVPHTFEYPVRYALLDLDRASSPSHLSASRAREVAATNGPVLLLTVPESVGYEQNPLSVYYCYDVAQEEEEREQGSPRLKSCIAEVTNTPWGERVTFVFNPGSDLVAKPLHVSPFMDMLGNWNIRADAPGEDLFLAISVQHPTLGNYFYATLLAKRVSSSSSPLNQALFFWLMPQKVALWIYWQALKLWWKNVSFIHHPKYMSPMYREEALKRDRELCCSFRTGQNKDKHSSHTVPGDNVNRWCVWRDAEWPWS